MQGPWCGEWLAVLAVLALLVTETCQFSDVSRAELGTFDFLELDSAAYQVEIASAPVSELQLQESLQAQGEKEVLRVPVLSKHGQLYSCSLPPLPAETEREEADPSPESLPNVTTLLKPLGDACLIKTVGWWTYEYCHNMFVRQYHMEGGRILGETKYLGFYQSETVWDQEHITRVRGLLDSLKGNTMPATTQAFHNILFVNGTECDVTGMPRSARVEIYCRPEGGNRIVEVKETTTCNYTLAIHTPLLCQHPMLLPLGSSTPSHTLSCTPVVSQLDYEDYLLRQELIKQQKEKLKAVSEDTSASREEERDTLLSSNQQLLRQLVMSSITQLAEIAYDTGNNLGQVEKDLDEIDEDDKEVGGSGQNSREMRDGIKRLPPLERSGESKEKSSVNRAGETEERSSERASEKMKKMANNVKSSGRDSALESLLSNLAVTAQYIESLDSDEDGGREPSELATNENSDGSTEPSQGHQEAHEHRVLHSSSSTGAREDSPSVKGPPLVENKKAGKGRTSSSGESDGSEDSRSTTTTTTATTGGGRSIGEVIMAASEKEKEGKEEEGIDLDSEAVREFEQQLQETLAKKFNTDDVTVKIVTLPEDQLQELESELGEEGEGEGEGEVGEKEGGVSGQVSEDNLTAAMALLLDSLLNGVEEEEEVNSEDSQRQSDLVAGYDHVWGREQQEKRKTQQNI